MTHTKNFTKEIIYNALCTIVSAIHHLHVIKLRSPSINSLYILYMLHSAYIQSQYKSKFFVSYYYSARYLDRRFEKSFSAASSCTRVRSSTVLPRLSSRTSE